MWTGMTFPLCIHFINVTRDIPTMNNLMSTKLPAKIQSIYSYDVLIA
jgi:hypothetical protein